MDFIALSQYAVSKGFDSIAIVRDGTNTKVVMDRRMATGASEERLVTCDFDDALETRALHDLAAAGWDTTFTTKGVRAFKSNARPFAAERDRTAMPRTLDVSGIVPRYLRPDAPQTQRSPQRHSCY